MSRSSFRQFVLREVWRLRWSCRSGFVFLIHQTKQSRHILETRNLDIKGTKQIQSNTYPSSKIVSEIRQNANSPLIGEALEASYERIWKKLSLMRNIYTGTRNRQTQNAQTVEELKITTSRYLPSSTPVPKPWGDSSLVAATGFVRTRKALGILICRLFVSSGMKIWLFGAN